MKSDLTLEDRMFGRFGDLTEAEASDTEAFYLTVSPLAGMIKIGDRVSYARDPHSTRRIVAEGFGSGFSIKLFVRPSRGFARHIRKQKRNAHAHR